MTKKKSKKKAQCSSCASEEGYSVSVQKVVMALLLAVVVGVILRRTRATGTSSLPQHGTTGVNVVERRAVRLEEDVNMKVLKMRQEPLVLLNTTISGDIPPWIPQDIARMMTKNVISGAYRSNESAIFGTYYDINRPMHMLQNVHNSIRYEDDVMLSRGDIIKAFPSGDVHASPPYYLLSTSLLNINPKLEQRIDIRELVSLNPAKSSVNIWLSSPGSVTPCHFDGYYNMYLQLSGSKVFTLLPPESRISVNMYPFLHPSFGQCKNAFLDETSNTRGESVPTQDWQNRVVIHLQPGEILFIPPYWIHEVEAVSSSVSVNFWTDVPISEVFFKILGMDIPGLSNIQFDPSLPIPLTAEDMTLLPVHLSSLTGRYILGYIIAVEVVEGCVGKVKTKEIFKDVASRYKPLLEDGTLIDMPTIMLEPLAELLSKWKVPLIATKKIIKYKEVVGEDELIKDLRDYIKIVLNAIKTADISFQPITLGHYLEFLSERVCSTVRSASFITLLKHAYSLHIIGAQ